MHEYGVRDVERLLGLSRRTLWVLIDAGFVQPRRGARNTLRFSFQDLIVLRTAQALSAAKLSNRKINQSLRELRKQLPDALPLSGLRIDAVGQRVVVREGKTRWQAGSGQYLLAFEGDPETGSLSIIERPASSLEPSEDWFERALALEDRDVEAAVHAYEQAIAVDPGRIDARINLGRLLHEHRHLARAERAYRDALALDDEVALLWFNRYSAGRPGARRRSDSSVLIRIAPRTGYGRCPLQPLVAPPAGRPAARGPAAYGAVSAFGESLAVAEPIVSDRIRTVSE